MDLPSTKDLIDIIYKLLPGFVVAWIFYGLTAYLKPAPFERIIQALIFTVIVRVEVIIFREAAFLIGEFKHVWTWKWSSDAEFICSFCLAIILGLFLSWGVNNDFPLYLLRNDGANKCGNLMKRVQSLLSKISLTTKTLYPSEWFSAFNDEGRYIVLHLTNGTRLKGWPHQFPDDPNYGHFLLDLPVWLLDNGDEVPLYSVHQSLVSAKDVRMIEFLKYSRQEIEASDDQIKNAQEKITILYKENKNVD